MLTISGLKNFYFLPHFHDMRCGYARIMEIIRISYHRNPYKGDVFFFMSKNERTVRMLMYERHAFHVHSCTFAKGYHFMKIKIEDEKSVYQVDWKDLVAILESPVVKEIRIKECNS
ncbi:MAG: IS66 family insertion sequence element accessory protein TnpB [Bacteroides sp.]|nr:IS66 family insertion sequence element accessory protein TnpB [Bacteroides sp.]MCI1683836.1 IS66 family insertion sequence element accessory protein TnpB [Bacteroides sp.]